MLIGLYNLEAEQSLLAALLTQPAVYDDICAIVTTDDFYAPQHQRIYTVLSNAYARGQAADAAALKHIFDQDSELEERGFGQYLMDLKASCVTTFNAANYATFIHDLATRRRAIVAANELIERVQTLDCQVDAECERLMTSVAGPSVRTTSQAVGIAAEGAIGLMEALRKGQSRAYKTGFDALNGIIGGLFPSGLYILAARPGMGKTALALNMADTVAAHTPVLFHSLEMPADELAMRMIAARSGVPVGLQRSDRHLHKSQWDEIMKARADLASSKLVIDARAGITVHEIAASARRFKRKHGAFVLFVDYLGLIAGDPRIQNKVHQIEAITTGLKTLAKELDVPVVLLSQLSRSIEQRADKRPMLSDLRDSGAIEQDADVVMFIYRDDYYEARKSEGGGASALLGSVPQKPKAPEGAAEIIIEKNRQGERGTAHVLFDGPKQKFYEA